MGNAKIVLRRLDRADPTGATRQYSTKLAGDTSTWAKVATVLLKSSPYLWIDQNPVAGDKFYQAIMRP